MPTVLRERGFHVVIFLPPREHEPPHVHVRNANGECVVVLAGQGRRQEIRTLSGMRPLDAVSAFWLVEDNADYLLDCWRKLHGDA